MTEQPPSASKEALDLAERIRDWQIPEWVGAKEIDALCEQRVSAERERIAAEFRIPVLALTARPGEITEADKTWADGVIRAPAERPAPEGPRRVMEGMRREGLPDDHPLQSGPSALAASTGEQPASPAAVVDAIDPLEQARQRGFEQGIAAAAEYAEARPNEQPAVLAGLMRDLGSMYAAERPAPPQQQGQTEWLVIESSMKNSVFAPEGERDRKGYIPRETAEKVLGRNLSGPQWFTREDGDKMREHPDWRDTVPPERPAPEGPQQSGDIVRWGVLRLLSGDLASDEEKVDAELDLDDFQFWFQENPKHTGFKQLLINLSGEQWGKLKELPLVEERSLIDAGLLLSATPPSLPAGGGYTERARELYAALMLGDRDGNLGKIAAALYTVASERDAVAIRALEVAYQAGATNEHAALLARLREPDEALVDAVARALDSNEVMDVPDHTRGPHIGFPEAEKSVLRAHARAALTKIAEMLK